ncbi:hypothetical protein KI387_010558, partial [Taxus chinensis]
LDMDLKDNMVSNEAWEVVSRIDSIFIQFAYFTYLRVIRFSREPVKLPKYPNDRLITMELSRKLVE